MIETLSIAQTLSVILWGLVFGMMGSDLLRQRPFLGLAIFGLGFFFIRIAADLLEDGRPDRIVAAMIYWIVAVGSVFVTDKVSQKKYGE